MNSFACRRCYPALGSVLDPSLLCTCVNLVTGEAVVLAPDNVQEPMEVWYSNPMMAPGGVVQGRADLRVRREDFQKLSPPRKKTADRRPANRSNANR